MTEYGNGDGGCGVCGLIVMGLVRVDGDGVLGCIVRSSLAVGGDLLLNACLGLYPQVVRGRVVLRAGGMCGS